MAFLKSNKFSKIASLVGLILFVVTLIALPSSRAAVPSPINYQGKLTDASANALVGNYQVKFKIYTAATDGTCLWSAGNNDSNTATVECDTSYPITVSLSSTGIFSANLGDTTDSLQNAFPSVLFNTQTLYLGVTVCGAGTSHSNVTCDAEMTPRKQLLTSPFAYRALYADSASGTFSAGGDISTTVDGFSSSAISAGLTFSGTGSHVIRASDSTGSLGFQTGLLQSDALSINSKGLTTLGSKGAAVDMLNVGGGISGGTAPATATTLSSGMTAADTTATVVLATGYAPQGGVLLIGDELIIYTGITATTFTGLTRGAFGTTAATHSSGATVLVQLLTLSSSSTIKPNVRINSSESSTSHVVPTLATIPFTTNALIWNAAKSAFRAGAVGNLAIVDQADTSTYWDDSNIGYYSTAFGLGTKASGFTSVAGGLDIISSGSASIAFGHGVTASGADSVAIGDAVIANAANAMALGNQATASGSYGLAMGTQVTASGLRSVALGSSVTASATDSIAIGSGLFTNSTSNSLAIGFGTSPTLSVTSTTVNVTGTLTTTNSATELDTPDKKVVNGTSTATFNTNGGNLNNYGGYFNNTSTKSVGSNTLTNIGLYANASGGDANYAAVFPNGNVGIRTETPSYDLSFSGTGQRTIGMERQTSPSNNGQGLTILAGGAKTGVADQTGGDIDISTGTATGNGGSNIKFKTAGGGVSGTSDSTPSTKLTIDGNGTVTLAAASATLSCGSGTCSFGGTWNKGGYVSELVINDEQSSMEAGDIISLSLIEADAGTIPFMHVKKATTAGKERLMGVMTHQWYDDIKKKYEEGSVLPGKKGSMADIGAYQAIKVTNENGAIAIGDLITVSSKPGVGMKATQAGGTVGVALQTYDKATIGTIKVFIRLDNVYHGSSTTSTTIAQPATTVAGGTTTAPSPTLITQSSGVPTIISGHAELTDAEVRLNFSSDFAAIAGTSYRVTLTPTQAANFYISAKDQNGFSVKAVDGVSTGTFDWVVIAQDAPQGEAEKVTTTQIQDASQGEGTSIIPSEEELKSFLGSPVAYLSKPLKQNAPGMLSGLALFSFMGFIVSGSALIRSASNRGWKGFLSRVPLLPVLLMRHPAQGFGRLVQPNVQGVVTHSYSEFAKWHYMAQVLLLVGVNLFIIKEILGLVVKG